MNPPVEAMKAISAQRESDVDQKCLDAMRDILTHLLNQTPGHVRKVLADETNAIMQRVSDRLDALQKLEAPAAPAKESTNAP